MEKIFTINGENRDLSKFFGLFATVERETEKAVLLIVDIEFGKCSSMRRGKKVNIWFPKSQIIVTEKKCARLFLDHQGKGGRTPPLVRLARRA